MLSLRHWQAKITLENPLKKVTIGTMTSRDKPVVARVSSPIF